MSSPKGREIIINGWEAAGISDAIQMGSEGLPSLDPFQDISPISNKFAFVESNAVFDLSPKEMEYFKERVNLDEDDGDCDWEPNE